MNELPELVSRRIWKYKLQQTFTKIKYKQHRLIKKHTSHERLDFPYDNIRMFAYNYNILRIMFGMGSLSYAN